MQHTMSVAGLRQPHEAEPLEAEPLLKADKAAAGDTQISTGVSLSSVDAAKLEAGLLQQKPAPRESYCGLPVQVVAGLVYCASGMAMVLLSKLALSRYSFTAPICLLLFQCTFAAVAVQISAALGLVEVEPWNTDIAKVWLPVPIIFVAMLSTSFYALQLLSVPMMSVLKNLASLFTIFGDMALYGKSYNWSVWATLVLMAISALCGAVTDLSFNARGYGWQIVNCGFTAAYSLTLRGVMDRVKPLTKDSGPLSEFGMVFYNNLLSVPLLVLLALAQGELQTLYLQPAMRNPSFLAAAASSAICGFAISFGSLWFLSSTTATMYSLVGSLNKIPVAVIGLFAFESTWSAANIASTLVGLLASVVFVWAKSSSSKPAQ